MPVRKDSIIVKCELFLSDDSCNFPNQICDYIKDTYGECKILTVTRKTGESEVEYYIVLKFTDCGHANRVKQRYHGRCLFSAMLSCSFFESQLPVTYITHSMLANLLEKANSTTSTKKKKKTVSVEKEQEKWMWEHGLLEEEQEEGHCVFFTERETSEETEAVQASTSSGGRTVITASTSRDISREEPVHSERPTGSSRTDDYYSVKNMLASRGARNMKQEKSSSGDESDDDDNELSEDRRHIHQSGVGFLLQRIQGSSSSGSNVKEKETEKERKEKRRTHKEEESKKWKSLYQTLESKRGRRGYEKSRADSISSRDSSVDHSSRHRVSHLRDRSIDSNRTSHYSRDSSLDDSRRKSRDKVYSTTTSRDSSLDSSVDRSKASKRARNLSADSSSSDSSDPGSRERRKKGRHHERSDKYSTSSSSSSRRREKERFVSKEKKPYKSSNSSSSTSVKRRHDTTRGKEPSPVEEKRKRHKQKETPTKASPTTSLAKPTTTTATVTTPTTSATTATVTTPTKVSNLATPNSTNSPIPNPIQFLQSGFTGTSTSLGGAPLLGGGAPSLGGGGGSLFPLIPPFPLSLPPSSNGSPVPLMVPIYLPPDYRQLLTGGGTNGSKELPTGGAAVSTGGTGISGGGGDSGGGGGSGGTGGRRSRSGTPLMDETPVTMVTLAPPVKDENSSENNINISENVSLCPPGEEEENIRTAPGGATVTNEIGIQTEGEESAAVEPVGVESEEEESEVDEYAGVKVGPEVDFKRMKSKILKSYLDKANILVASARVMSNTDSKNKDVILRSLRKSLSALGKRGLREFRIGAGIIKQE